MTVKGHIHWQYLLAQLSSVLCHENAHLTSFGHLGRCDTNRIGSILCCIAQGCQGKYASDCRMSLSLAFSPWFFAAPSPLHLNQVIETRLNKKNIDIESLQNRLVKVCYVPATSPSLNRFLFFFLLRSLTVLMKQTRQAVCAVKQSILLRCLWKNTSFCFCSFQPESQWPSSTAASTSRHLRASTTTSTSSSSACWHRSSSGGSPRSPLTWCRCYKTFFVHKLWIFIIS